HPDLAPADSHGQADGAGPYCSSPTARRLYAGASTSSTKGAAYAIAVSCNSALPVSRFARCRKCRWNQPGMAARCGLTTSSDPEMRRGSKPTFRPIWGLSRSKYVNVKPVRSTTPVSLLVMVQGSACITSEGFMLAPPPPPPAPHPEPPRPEPCSST